MIVDYHHLVFHYILFYFTGKPQFDELYIALKYSI